MIDFVELIYGTNNLIVIVVILISLFIAVCIMVFKMLEGIYGYFYKPKFINKAVSRKYVVSDHPIFKRFDNILNDKIPALKEKCPARKLIFLQLLEIKIQNIKENFQELLHDNIDDISADVFKIHILTLLNNTTMMFYKKTFDNEIQNNIVNKFEKKMYPTKELVESLICNICDSTEWYETNIEKLINILDLISAYEAYVIAEIECVINEVHADISRVIYEGTASSSCALDRDFEIPSNTQQKILIIKNNLVNNSLVKTVLYVEDNIGSATIMTKGLARFNAYVIVAKTVMEALELLDKITIDVAIIDYNLPDMPGTCLEESLEYYKIPFLYYTAVDVRNIKTNAKILSKPYNLLDINNELNALITSSKKELSITRLVN